MPGPGDENLGEVERALSVLQGRHPEHERVRREDAAKQAALRATREEAASVAHGIEALRRWRSASDELDRAMTCLWLASRSDPAARLVLDHARLRYPGTARMEHGLRRR